MSEQAGNQPFRQLGERLKIIRQKLHESVSEVSGAVEIDVSTLQRIEQGDERPSEDILMLLISHFGMRDDEAASLWQLAGYDQPRNEHESDDSSSKSATILVMAVDPRIVYSDGIQVSANNNGVVLSFSQGSGTTNSLTTARIGMSREQAQSVLSTLQEALVRSEPRQLPHSFDTKTDEK